MQLTDAGWEMFRSVIRESNMVESDVLKSLSVEDRTVLADLLERAISDLDEIED